jgi:hypothetical protein
MGNSLDWNTGAEYTANGCKYGVGGCTKRDNLSEIGEEEEEEDEAEGQNVHQQAEDDAGVVEGSVGLQTADGVERAIDGQQGGDDEQQRGAGAGKAGDTERRGEAPQYKEVAAEQRAAAKMEDSEG